MNGLSTVALGTSPAMTVHRPELKKELVLKHSGVDLANCCAYNKKERPALTASAGGTKVESTKLTALYVFSPHGIRISVSLRLRQRT
jgi:hypothetical protein